MLLGAVLALWVAARHCPYLEVRRAADGSYSLHVDPDRRLLEGLQHPQSALGAAVQATTPVVETPAARLDADQRGRLDAACWGAVRHESFAEIFRFQQAGDAIGVKQLQQRGDVVLLDAGTGVLLVNRGLLFSQVRVLDGDHAGALVWVEAERARSSDRKPSGQRHNGQL